MDFTKYKNPRYKNTHTSQTVCGTITYPTNNKKRSNICDVIFSYIISIYNKYVRTS